MADSTLRSRTLQKHKADLRSLLIRGLARPLLDTDLDVLGAKYEGKVRDNYSTKDGRRYVVATDRISAFDRVIGTLPFKGQLLTGMAAFWFERTKYLAPNHVIATPDPSVMECIECTPLPVEMVVRSYVTGVTSTSIWTHYAAGKRDFCGHRLPDGLRKNERLPTPILTPSTKAEKGGHDVSAARDEILLLTKMDPRHFDAAAEMAMVLFGAGVSHAAAQGLILVDTKYEFGIDTDGRVRVIDEIHTPDSSRYWYAHNYQERFDAGEEPESFDKEYVRRWLAAEGYTGDGPPPTIPDDVRVEAAMRYAEAYERITGMSFAPNEDPPLPRIRQTSGSSVDESDCDCRPRDRA